MSDKLIFSRSRASQSILPAFDIFKKFKYPNQKLRHFVRYIFYVYLIPLAVVSVALTFEFSPQTARSLFRPRYGQRICGISAPMAKLVFLTVPINLSLIVNIVIFLIAIYKIKKVVNEISHSSISSSIRERCMWYAKLSLLLGISSMFGYFGIQLPCCQSLKFATFLINAMHGTGTSVNLPFQVSLCSHVYLCLLQAPLSLSLSPVSDPHFDWWQSIFSPFGLVSLLPGRQLMARKSPPSSLWTRMAATHARAVFEWAPEKYTAPEDILATHWPQPPQSPLLVRITRHVGAGHWRCIP